MTLPATLILAARCVRSRIALAVLVALHNDFDEREFMKPPICLLATRTGASERQVYRAILELERLGYLERGERVGNALTYRIADLKAA
jgi:DNA-binding IclR family transcriptional regulator